MASLVVAQVAAASIYGLSRWATRSAGTERQLVQLRSALNERDGLEWGGAGVRRVGRRPRLRPADELVQVGTKLPHNAIHAMEGRGGLRLGSRRHDVHVVVSVTDPDPGVPPALQAKSFDPFVSTKPRGEGTGLALHSSRQIIARHGGVIQLDSQPGRTTFSVRLRIAPAPAACACTRSENSAVSTPAILCVDDEALIPMSPVLPASPVRRPTPRCWTRCVRGCATPPRGASTRRAARARTRCWS